MSAQQGKVLVTGATGFIGTQLVAALVDRGEEVRALSRRTKIDSIPAFPEDQANPLEHPAVEIVPGDITDARSVYRAMDGCRRVFHLAGHAKNWDPDPKTYYRVNVEGTRNVFDAAERHDVERTVWTSSFATMGNTSPGVVGDERIERMLGKYKTHYAETKAQAEQEADLRAQNGLPVVTVCPTRVFGPGLVSEANSVMRVIDQYDRGRMPYLPNWGVNIGNYVYVEDLINGLFLTMEKARIGERYLLGGENISLKQFFRTIDALTGKRHFQIPIYRLAPTVFAYFQQKRAEWFGMYPLITPGWIDMYLNDGVFSSEKAARELDYHTRPLAEGLRLSIEWLERVREQFNGRLPLV